MQLTRVKTKTRKKAAKSGVLTVTNEKPIDAGLPQAHVTAMAFSPRAMEVVVWSIFHPIMQPMEEKSSIKRNGNGCAGRAVWYRVEMVTGTVDGCCCGRSKNAGKILSLGRVAPSRQPF